MFSLVLQFPFKINKEPVEQTHKVVIERKENLVSFALEFKYPITIDHSTCLSISNSDGLYVYVFKFDDINKALQFLDDPKATVKRVFEFPDVENLIAKTNKKMLEYEKNEKLFKKKKKRRLVRDSEGFMKYEN